MENLMTFYVAIGVGAGATVALPLAVMFVRSWLFRYSTRGLELQREKLQLQHKKLQLRRDELEQRKRESEAQIQLKRESMQLQHEMDKDRLLAKEFEVAVEPYVDAPSSAAAVYVLVRLEGGHGGQTYSEECVARASYTDEVSDTIESMQERYFAWVDKMTAIREGATSKQKSAKTTSEAGAPRLMEMFEEQVGNLAPAILGKLMGAWTGEPAQQKSPEADLPFDRFTKPAREVMGRARQETEKANHNETGTGHLLLGLLMQESTMAHFLLDEAGVTYKMAQRELLKVVGPGTTPTTVGAKIPFTKRGVEVVTAANAEREKLGHPKIEPAHLLLGLMADPESISAQILMNLGAKTADLREKLMRLLQK